MEWKNFPYWLKGGIIGAITPFAVAGLVGIINSVYIIELDIEFYFLLFALFLFIPSFIIGSLIGLIYGKMKSKKKIMKSKK